MHSISSMGPAYRCAATPSRAGRFAASRRATGTHLDPGTDSGRRSSETSRSHTPGDYLLGLDDQKWEEEVGFLRLSGGKLVRGGRWYDPFLILGGKLPLGTFLLLGATLALTLTDLRHPSAALWAVWLPPLSMLALLCGQTGLNWIIRYHLILFPFLFVGIGRLVEAARGKAWARLLIVACLLWNAGVLFRTRPDYLSYGNELVGGPD